MFDEWISTRAPQAPVVIALFALAACTSRDADGAATQPDADQKRAVGTSTSAVAQPREPAPPPALRGLKGVFCQTPTNDIQACATADYDISGSDAACADDGANFGAVLAEQGVDLLDGMTRGRTRAHLAHHQFVCIHYVAESRTGGAGWSFVTAIPAPRVEACRISRCPNPDSPVRWNVKIPAGSCVKQANNRYSAACAAGWVPSSALDTYSMGLSS